VAHAAMVPAGGACVDKTNGLVRRPKPKGAGPPGVLAGRVIRTAFPSWRQHPGGFPSAVLEDEARRKGLPVGYQDRSQRRVAGLARVGGRIRTGP
jgi:hypothetical protein